MEEKKQIELVEKFQCPGCVCGMDTDCGKFHWSESNQRCSGHVLGTVILPGGNIAIGLPKGFNKPGFSDAREGSRNTMDITFWESGKAPEWDHLNVAVWAMVEDGFLFVRTFSPRLNYGRVDVIEGGTIDMVPGAMDVSKFESEID